MTVAGEQPLRRSPITSALLAATIGITSLALSLCGPNTLARTDSVEIRINDQQLTIPGDYIASLPYDSDGTVLHVRLTVFWPTMEPLKNIVPQKLELPGPQGINVLLRKRPRDGYQMLHRAMEAGRLDGQYQAGPFGLRAYVKDNERARRTTRRFTSVETQIRTPSGDPVVFDCDDHFSWDAHETMDLEPICESNYTVTGSVGLTYWFYRKNLSSWREIDGAIRHLVQSFLLEQEG